MRLTTTVTIRPTTAKTASRTGTRLTGSSAAMSEARGPLRWTLPAGECVRSQRPRYRWLSRVSSRSRGPPSNARLASRPKWLPPGYKLGLFMGNAVYGFRMQLYCRTGYHLGIFPDKKVRGIADNIHPYGELKMVTFSPVKRNRFST